MLEIIVVGRADNHTGDFGGRLIYASQFNARALAEADVDFQFTFVEWNSPHDKLGTLAHRYINEVPNSKAYVVGPEWHSMVCDNPKMVIMEFFAKNVALRRSTAKVALCTNADILFGPDTVELLAGWQGCQPRTLYRTVHRTDIKSDRVYERAEELTSPDIVVKNWKSVPPAYTQGAGDFQMALVSYWKALLGYDETIRWAKIHKDHRLCSQVIKLKGKIVATGSCYHLWHKSSYVNHKRLPQDPPWGPEYNPELWMPYTNDRRRWGLGHVQTTKVMGFDMLVPAPKMREIPPLPKHPTPVGVSKAVTPRKRIQPPTPQRALKPSPKRQRTQPPPIARTLRPGPSRPS